jgi:hypothetical protein
MKSKNIYYVYIYLDPRKVGTFTYGQYTFDHEPFYVGKGKEDRLQKHLIFCNLRNDKNKHKVNKILKIKQETNQNPIIIKYKDNMLVEQDAFDLEIDMITKIGRADLHKGPLTNLTDGGEGTSGHTQIVSEKRKKLIRKLMMGRVFSNDTIKLMSKRAIERGLGKGKNNPSCTMSKEQLLKRMRKINTTKINHGTTGKDISKSEKHKRNIALALKGKTKSKEHIKNMGKAQREWWQNLSADKKEERRQHCILMNRIRNHKI